MSSIAAAILIFCLAGVLFGSSRFAGVAFLVGTLYLTQSQALNIAGFQFYPTRLIGSFAFLRVLARGELRAISSSRVDSALLILYGYTTLVLCLRPGESIPLRLAKTSDVLFCYFAFRVFILNLSELRWFLTRVAILLVPYVALLLLESAGGNPFALFGASHSLWLREGNVRCFGTFRHPSLLGSLGATFFPLFVALVLDPARRRWGLLGAACSILIVLSSNSGGPLSAFAAGVLGWLLWRYRSRMQTFRRLLAGFVVVMSLVMTAPIWYLLARLSAITGGTGWHRSYLMDVAFQNLDKWWLFGLPTEETAGWFPYNLAATGGADVTNQFISFGLNGGLLAIFLCLWLIVRAYRVVGSARFAVAENDSSLSNQHLVWGLGVVMTVHVVNWLGITYWDQFYVIFFAQLAALVSCSEAVLAPEEVPLSSPEMASETGMNDACSPA